MADIYAKHRAADFETIDKMTNDEWAALNDAEKAVYEELVDLETMEKLPPDFFKNKSVDELNKHFGGHDNMVITEKLKEALDGIRCEVERLAELAEMFPKLPKK